MPEHSQPIGKAIDGGLLPSDPDADAPAEPLPHGGYLELSNKVFEDGEGHIVKGRGIPPAIALDIYPEDAPIAGHKTALERVVEMIKAG